jgi:hypothetical protein
VAKTSTSKPKLSREELIEKVRLAKEQAGQIRTNVVNKVATMKAEAAAPMAQHYVEPEMTGNPEIDDANAHKAMMAAFKSAVANEEARFNAATDAEFWCCLCFQTDEQKMAFLTAMKWLQFGGPTYIDGEQVAAQMGVTLPVADVPYDAGGRKDPKFLAFVKPDRRV